LRTLRAVVAAAAASLTIGAVGSPTASAAPAGAIPLGGGSGIIFSTGTMCTLTTIGRDGAGRLVGLTAGHCAPVGALVAAEREHPVRHGVIQALGRVAARSKDWDYEVIEFVPGLVRPLRSVGGTTIARLGSFPGFGATVCDNGTTTGRDCNIVWGYLDGYWANQTCSRPGDSGGPITLGDRLVGMVNAGMTGVGPVLFPPCRNAADPVHDVTLSTSMDDILRDLNAHPGWIGAGFRPL
jgi:hypothetical protein